MDSCTGNLDVVGARVMDGEHGVDRHRDTDEHANQHERRQAVLPITRKAVTRRG